MPKKHGDKLRYSEIFVPGGNPSYTYNARSDLQLEEKISQVKDNLCKVIVVTGHTKSGKTVLVRTVLPPDETVWINGGDITKEEDFWTTIVEDLNLSQETESSTTHQMQTEVSGDATVGGSLVVVKGRAKLGSKLGATSMANSGSTQRLSSKTVALAGLRRLQKPLVIDDFHFLPKTIQQNIIRALKSLVFDGVPIVIIAIPHRRHDVYKLEREMTARAYHISVLPGVILNSSTYPRRDLSYYT